MSDHISAASVDPSTVVFLGMAILTTIALAPRLMRFGQRRGRFKR